jgi:hypothetical protein
MKRIFLVAGCLALPVGAGLIAAPVATLPAAAEGLFQVGETVTVTRATAGDIRVGSWLETNVWAGPSPLVLTNLAAGHYFVTAGAERTQFGVLPADYRGAPFLGSTADLPGTEIGQRNARIQPAWTRLGWESVWHSVSPRRGEWNWGPLDRRVALNQGRRIILMAYGRPDWVTDEEFVPAFVAYVRALVTRYHEQIYALEVWNEPWRDNLPGQGRNGWLQTYRDMLERCAPLIRAVDPRVKVFGPAWSDYRPRETATLASENLWRLLDGFSWHYYDLAAAAPDADQWDADNAWGYRGQAKSPTLYRGTLALAELVPGKQLIMDELGLYGRSALGFADSPQVHKSRISNLSWQRGAARAFKAVVMYRAAGVECILPHNLAVQVSPQEVDQWPGWEAEGRGPHPKTTALLMASDWLAEAKFLEEGSLGEGVSAFAWRRADDSLLIVLWLAEGQQRSGAATGPLHFADLFGRELRQPVLSEVPVLVSWPQADSLTAVWHALRGLIESSQD